MKLFKSILAGLVLGAATFPTLISPAAASGDLVMLKTRAGYSLNSHGSTGNVSAIPKPNYDPAVSDEIFRLFDLNGGSLRSGDKVYLKTRAGYFFNSRGSTGNVSAIPHINMDPNVSDEILTIYKVNGSGTIERGDKVYLKTRAGYFFNSHGSTGNVSAIRNANLNPKVSDEIFSIYFR